MSYLGARNAISLGVSYQATLGGPNLLNRLSPSLLLNFTNTSTLDPRITFTRSTTATFTGSNGLIQTAAIDAPRFDYNPTTLASLGLLIEEQRTNLFLQSQFASGWINFGTATQTPNNTAAPNGTTTAALVTSPATSDYIYQAPATTIGLTYVFSFFVKNSTATVSQYHVRTSNTAAIGTLTWSGATLSSVTPTVGTASFVAVGNGWYRVSAVYTATEAAARHRIGGGDGVSTTGNIFVWGAQLEVGAFATSYIPTVASQVTRAADVAVMTGTNFSSWYNASEGTLYAEAAVISTAYTTGVLLDVGAGGAFGTTAYINWFGSGWGLNPSSAPVNMSSSVVTTSPGKIAAALSANNAVIAANGLLGGVDTSCAMPASPTTLSIGVRGWSGGNGNFLNGTIRQIVYYPRRLANAELRGITR